MSLLSAAESAAVIDADYTSPLFDGEIPGRRYDGAIVNAATLRYNEDNYIPPLFGGKWLNPVEFASLAPDMLSFPALTLIFNVFILLIAFIVLLAAVSRHRESASQEDLCQKHLARIDYLMRYEQKRIERQRRKRKRRKHCSESTYRKRHK